MARIVAGPEITGRVVSTQTGSPLSGVTVTVNKTVYTDADMTQATTTLTTNGTGDWSCYAAPGNYTFTTTAAGAAPIEPVKVQGIEEGTGTPLNATYIAAQVVAAPTGVAATDSAALQAAHDALPASGGRIQLQAGDYDISNGVTFTKQVRLSGVAGGTKSGTANTRLLFSGGTGDAITSSGDGSIFEDFALVNTSGTAPTAGTGLKVTQGNFNRYRNLWVWKFYNCVDIDNSFYFSVLNCSFTDAVNYCLYMRNTVNGDNGDMSVQGSLFGGYFTSRVPNAGVCWESGGGLKFVGNKINGSISQSGGSHSSVDTGLLIQIADGVSTGVCTITGNSIEGWNSYGIRATTKGPSNTGYLQKIVVTGNEIAGNGGVGVYVGPQGSATSWKEVTVQGNSIGNCTVGVRATRVTGMNIGTNEFSSVTNTIIDLLANCYNTRVADQTVDQANVQLYNDVASDKNTHVVQQQTPMRFTREIPSTTSNSVYTTLFKVGFFQNFTALVAELVVTGNVYTKGVASVIQKRHIYLTTNGNPCTVTTVGTDFADGFNGSTAGFDVSWDASTSPGYVLVKIKLNATAGGSDIGGSATLTLTGLVGGVHN